MLEQLVESKNNTSENKRRARFLSATLFMVGIFSVTALTYSLFAKDLGAGDDGLDLSSLVAPVPLTNDAPPEPQIKKQPEKTVAATVTTTQPTRREAFTDIENSKNPPADTRGERNVMAWVKGSKIDPIAGNSIAVRSTRSGETVGSIDTSSFSTGNENIEPPPAVVKPKKEEPKKEEPKVDPPKKTVVKSDGVLNGKAINLVKPLYPAPAKAVRAAGAVQVQVTIDEAGNVISANAVSGHPLLRQVSESAARATKFSPTLLSKVPVKVTGMIVYNFVAQ